MAQPGSLRRCVEQERTDLSCGVAQDGEPREVLVGGLVAQLDKVEREVDLGCERGDRASKVGRLERVDERVDKAAGEHAGQTGSTAPLVKVHAPDHGHGVGEAEVVLRVRGSERGRGGGIAQDEVDEAGGALCGVRTIAPCKPDVDLRRVWPW